MSAPTGDFYMAGAKHARAMILNAAGIPAAAAADGVVYEGFEFATLKNFNIENPAFRKIVHYGGDSVRATDILPPNTVGGATMAVGSINPTTYAALTGTSVVTIGEMTGIGLGTSKRGYEPDVAVLAVQHAVNSENISRWCMAIVPIAKAIFKDGSMNENASEFSFDISLGISRMYPWGIAYDAGVEGFTRAEAVKFWYEHFPFFVAWLGDNVITEFLFHADRQAYSTDKIHGVWVYDVGTGETAIDATAAKAVDGVTPTAKPAAGDIVMCVYELEFDPE